jgi:hypothetical protein
MLTVNDVHGIIVELVELNLDEFELTESMMALARDSGLPYDVVFNMYEEVLNTPKRYAQES